MSAYEYVKPPKFLALFAKPPTDPILASTLADFVTGSATVCLDHSQWLTNDVADLIRSRPGCWVDLIGHASNLGDAKSNLTLSTHRVDRVEKLIRSALDPQDFESFKHFPEGSSHSGSVMNDDSPQYRSVEVLVYGTDAPKPPPPPPSPVTKEWLTSRVTTQHVVITKEPGEPGMGSGHGGRFVKIFNSAADSIKDKERVDAHPCEAGDPDFGIVKSTKSSQIKREFVITQATIERVGWNRGTTMHLGYYELTFDSERTYTFAYGPGNHDQKVSVKRHTKIFDEKGKVFVDTNETFLADQPGSYLDP